ncbi:MAG: formylglycine-generating enzyme family protein [Saprospiraceae bacterium]|nr:formylglycine-generating enzyme family protein [Lewinella sp.]
MDQPFNLSIDLPDLDLVFVEGGTFVMGDDESGFDREKPAHPVNVPSFYIGKYPVTQRLWQAVMGTNPSRFSGEKRPVESVSWDDTQDFIEQLNKKTGKTFRLPSEAEWEYAARGGKYSQGYLFSGSDKLKQVSWYDDNSNGETQEVGLLLLNELGLYDMSGNVYEWCEDDYHDNYQKAPGDAKAWIDLPKRGALRVLRGGSYFDIAVGCRCTNRNADRPDSHVNDIGFRLVLPFIPHLRAGLFSSTPFAPPAPEGELPPATLTD